MKRHPSRPRTRQEFVLTGVENRDVNNRNERLVCFVQGHTGLLVLWGTTGVDVRHIEAVERHGFPVRVVADWLQPNPELEAKFRHRFWIDEDDHFGLVD